MKTPKVSILIPTYNYARYLPETIESILAQDFADFELLISDDGSADDSAGVIARYAAKDKRIRFQIHSTNLGMVPNWNWCLSQARGEYIRFIFGDDKLSSPVAISQMVSLMESDPAISLVSSASLVIDSNSQVVGARDHFRRGVHDGKKIIVRCLERPTNLIGEPSLVMFRKKHAVRGFDTRYRQLVDLEMWFHLLENGKFGYLQDPLCAFRQHELQQTNLNRKSGETGDEIMWLLEEYMAKPWLPKLAARRMLFTQIYVHRKSKPNAALAKMKLDLGSGWYAALWLHHKTTKPFLNFQWSMKKRRTLRKHKLQPPSGIRE